MAAISERKVYACEKCGHQKLITTNHHGKCWSFGTYNTCPVCPPFRRPNTWVCLEPQPESLILNQPQGTNDV